MSEQDFVYGVFGHSEQAAAVIESLHKAGFKSEAINLVGPKTDQFLLVSARIQNPAKINFVRFGIVGALGGLWAGAVMAPTAPYVVQFQVLTTLMAAISGAIVLAYFSLFVSAFLTANDPQHYANVYEAELKAGEALVSVEAEGAEQRAAARAIMEEHEALELIVRRAQVGPIIGLEAQEQIPVSRPESVKKLSAVA